MGVDYHPRRRGVDVFFCNVSGNDLLGLLHAVCGAPIHEEGEIIPPEFVIWRVPYEATAALARDMADIIEASPELWRQALDRGGWAGTPEEWDDHVREWVKFLRDCGGYEGV